MSELKYSDLLWPPENFKELNEVTDLSAQAISKDPQTAKVIGASYSIEVSPLTMRDKKIYIYSFQIDGWEYTINNESREYPILSFVLKSDRGYSGVKNIKSLSCPIKTTHRSAQRTMMAAASILRHIKEGVVPDMEQSLKLHKIHPSQKRIYESQREAARRFFEFFDKTKKENRIL